MGSLTDGLTGEPGEMAASLLESLGLPSSPLWVADGWVNRVWLAPAHVVRLSSGRFRESLAHEARVLRLLPPEVPHARVVARQPHDGTDRREWLVLERIPGITLTAAWPALGQRERRRAIRQLGEILHALHQVEVPADLRPPWLEDALAPGGPIRDAYHAPPDRYGDLLAAAEDVPGVDRGVLREVGAFIAERLDAFAPEPAQAAPLVHVDVHFGNVMWAAGGDKDGGRISALLDFEGARRAPPDLELDTLLRFTREPHLYDWRPATLTPRDLTGVVDWLADAYPGLFSHPRLDTRLAVYEALWQLVQLLHYPPASGDPNPWDHVLALLDAGDHWSWR
jgi:aminoglycoside phosphotransferase (APT) family kinase protein